MLETVIRRKARDGTLGHTDHSPQSYFISFIPATAGDSPSGADAPKKLSGACHQAIKAMFKSLDKSKMWRLSTGKHVEEQMHTASVNATFEK